MRHSMYVNATAFTVYRERPRRKRAPQNLAGAGREFDVGMPRSASESGELVSEPNESIGQSGG